mgnify:CR=1 FL=1
MSVQGPWSDASYALAINSNVVLAACRVDVPSLMQTMGFITEPPLFVCCNKPSARWGEKINELKQLKKEKIEKIEK